MKTSFKYAIISTIIMVLYAQFVLGYYSSCFSISGELNSLGLNLNYSAKEVYNFFDIRSINQVQCYSNFIIIWDSIFPLIYTAMYLLWFRYFYNKWLLLSIIPILHMISDWIENYFEVKMINSYIDLDQIPSNLISISSSITNVKWTLSIFTYSIILIGIIYRIKKNRSLIVK